MASPNNAVRWAAENLRSVAFGAIGAQFTPIGDAIENPVRQIMLENATDVRLIFSTDGTNDKFTLAAGASVFFDITSNRTDMGGTFNLNAGQNSFLWVADNGVAPSLGAVYFSVFYGQS